MTPLKRGIRFHRFVFNGRRSGCTVNSFAAAYLCTICGPAELCWMHPAIAGGQPTIKAALHSLPEVLSSTYCIYGAELYVWRMTETVGSGLAQQLVSSYLLS